MNKKSRRAGIRTASILILLPLCCRVEAASLKPDTKVEWEAYLASAHEAMQKRLQPGATFLWIDEKPGLAEAVKEGRPYVAPIGPHIPKKVSSGLIHDWLGVGFVPKAKIPDIIGVLRGYDRYKEIYRPGVIESSARGMDGLRDLFSMRLVNKSVVSKTALDVEGAASYIRVDDHRWYAVSDTTRIREVEKFGTPEERTLPEDEGTGLIWRLSSITRLEERDGGVYAELEAIALSRDIPGAVRLFVTPIVRRVSRDSLATSLHQTRIAIDAQMVGREQERAAQ